MNFPALSEELTKAGWYQSLTLFTAMSAFVLAGGLLLFVRIRPGMWFRVTFLLLCVFFCLYGAQHVWFVVHPESLASARVFSAIQKVLLFCVGIAGMFAFPEIINLGEARSLYRVNRDLKREIQERKTIEAALIHAKENYEAIFENAVEGIIQTTPSGKFRAANPAFARMLGYENTADLLKNVTDIGGQIYCWREDRERFIELMKSKNSARMEYEAKRKDGKHVWLSVSARAVRDTNGKILYYESIAEDITEKKANERALKEGEECLRQSEERYRSLVSATASVVWTSDRTGAFTSPQPLWEAYTGQSYPEYAGWGWMEMFHPDERSALKEKYLKAITAGTIFHSEGRVWNNARGMYRYFEGRAVPIVEPSGRVREWVGALSDIHVRRETEGELNKFKFLSDNANDAYFLLNRYGRILYVNQFACRLLGYTCEELVKLHVPQIDDRGTEWVMKSDSAIADKAMPSTFESAFRRKDGTYAEVEVSISELDYRGEKLYFGIARDITERKCVEESLRKHAEELARSNRELEQFAYVSSHDLKEPLRMVRLYGELLNRHLGEQMDPVAGRYMRHLVEGAQRMQQMITDLLSYSRVGKELSPFAKISGARVVKSAIENLKAAMEESDVKIMVKSLPEFYGHEGQMVQLFQNLIGNAIKFRRNGSPEILITSETVGDSYIFSVEDNGIGVDARYVDRIFLVFQRLHPLNQYPGTGIGLSICKRIVEHHGGRIWVESVAGKGSRFRFSIPRAPSSNVPEGEMSLARPRSAGKTHAWKQHA